MTSKRLTPEEVERYAAEFRTRLKDAGPNTEDYLLVVEADALKELHLDPEDYRLIWSQATDGLAGME